MTQTFVLGACALLAAAAGEPRTVRIVDESGAPVERCEVMWHTENDAYGRWGDAEKGQWRAQFSDDVPAVDLIVRCDGFATEIRHLDRHAVEQLFREGATIRLQRGREVQVILQLPAGTSVPAGAKLNGYVPQFAPRVRSSWPPYNRNRSEPDFNLLNLTRAGGDQYTLRLPDEPGTFSLAFHEPGWLQFCELGPYSAEDIEDGMLRIEVPKPAKIDVVFDADRVSLPERPFHDATLMVYYAPGSSGVIYGVTDHDTGINLGEHVVFDDLGPGEYIVQVRTKPKKGVEANPGTDDINPGRYFDREIVNLASGDVRPIEFAWAPFDPESYRGPARAEITIRNPDGSAPAGQTATVAWHDGHYGSIVVHQGPVPENGVLTVGGISAKRRPDTKFGPFTVAVDGERLGFFSLEDTADVQEFEFTITPGVGDLAPDVELVDATTGGVSKLSDHRGRVVCLEFWGVGCGPCQPAMKALNDFAAAKQPEWQDDFVVLSVSTDRDAQIVREHAAGAGWTAFPHYLGARDDGEYFCAASRAFVVYGIPEAVVIDREGRITWRGHPAGDGFHDAIEALLSQ